MNNKIKQLVSMGMNEDEAIDFYSSIYDKGFKSGVEFEKISENSNG